MDMRRDKEKKEKEGEEENPSVAGKTLLYIVVCLWILPITKPKLNFPLSAKLSNKEEELKKHHREGRSSHTRPSPWDVTF